MIFVGIDPGVKGAIAVLAAEPLEKPSLVGIWDMPLLTDGGYDIEEVDSLINNISDQDGGRPVSRLKKFVAIERVWALPGQGAHAGYMMGEAMMIWKALLTAAGIQFIQVVPPVWKRTFMKAIPYKGPAPFETEEDKAKREKLNRLIQKSRKDKAREIALKLYPQSASLIHLKKHDGRAEALLIAEHGRRHYLAHAEF